MSSVRVIECSCGEWEELPADSPRHHVAYFKHLRNVKKEAIYTCTCGKNVKSKTIKQ